jgi:hypothetical protein
MLREEIAGNSIYEEAYYMGNAKPGSDILIFLETRLCSLI